MELKSFLHLDSGDITDIAWLRSSGHKYETLVVGNIVGDVRVFFCSYKGGAVEQYSFSEPNSEPIIKINSRTLRME